YLEMLARYAQQLAQRLVQIFQQSLLVENATQVQTAVLEPIADLAGALFAKAEERAHRTWTQHFSWAAADGRQLRSHHLAGLCRCLDVVADHGNLVPASPKSEIGSLAFANSGLGMLRPWLRVEDDARAVMEEQRQWSQRLDDAFPRGSWHDRERQVSLTAEQN